MGFTLMTGAEAPDFQLPGVDGKRYRLADFDAFPLLVISFTCNHCPYVIGNESREKAFVEKYSQRGVGYVAINSNETQNHPTDDFEHMKQRSMALAFSFPYLRDEDQSAAKAYGAIRTPHFYLFDHNSTGRRILRYNGRMDNSPRDITKANTHELADAVDDLLAGKPLRLAVTDSLGCNVKWRGKEKHFIPNDVCDLV